MHIHMLCLDYFDLIEVCQLSIIFLTWIVIFPNLKFLQQKRNINEFKNRREKGTGDRKGKDIIN